MGRGTRPRQYLDHTEGICNTCLDRVQARIEEDDSKRIFMVKRCPDHGKQETILASDGDYYKSAKNYVKRGEIPERFNTSVSHGCPFDCGLCTDHQQHSCLSVVEVTDHCNLECPTCYAGSSPKRAHRSFEQVKAMLDCVVRSEGEPDIVQISGGEPTTHPDFFKILDYAKKLPIRHLMVNTNGIKVAKEEGFAEKLAQYAPGFELYFQFDGFDRETFMRLRGADLREIKQSALEKLNNLNVSTTLVSTVQRGVNDHEIGKTLEYAVQQRAVRGVVFQPVQAAGRNEGFDPAKNRYTLTDVRSAILAQTQLFQPNDIIPVPCNPDSLAMAYAFKCNNQIYPLTRHVDPSKLLDGSKNTFLFEQQPDAKNFAVKLFSTGNSPEGRAEQLHHLLCCLPEVSAPGLSYDNVFRVVVNAFMDKYSFDVRSARKICVTVAHPDGRRMIPFDTMNIFYRDEKENYLSGSLLGGKGVVPLSISAKNG